MRNFEDKASRGFGVRIVEEQDIRLLPDRRGDGNKGTFGKVLVIAGSRNMSGAAYLCGMGCFRTGVGMVKIHSAECNRQILQCQLPEAMFSTYEDAWTECGVAEEIQNHEHRKVLDDGIGWCDGICVGPGLGKRQVAGEMVFELLKSGDKPLVIDADGLNLLRGHLELLRSYRGICVVTPHLGEMERLTGRSISGLKKDLFGAACSFAKEHQVYCVLKDAKTVVATPNGECYLNTSGNSGMATAGSGDVLAGIVAGFLTQTICNWSEEAQTWDMPGEHPDELGLIIALAVYIHGLAGDEARRMMGTRAMMARDLIDQIGPILMKYKEEDEL